MKLTAPNEAWVVEYTGAEKPPKCSAYWTAEPSLPFGVVGAAVRFHSKADANAVIGSDIFSRHLRGCLKASLVQSDD